MLQEKKKPLFVSITVKLFTFPDSRIGESVAGNILHQAAKSISRRLARELLSSYNVDREGKQVRALYW